MKTLADAFVAALVVALVLPAWFLPWRAACALGRWYGYAGYVLYPAGRRIGLINLRRAFGDSLSRRDAARMTRQVFANLTEGIAAGLQAIKFHRRDPRRVDARIVVEDPALNARILDDPRPKILVTGHLGSWDLTTIVAAARHGSGAVLARRVDNRFLEAILGRLRGRVGAVAEKHGGTARLLECLDAGQHVALLADENDGTRGLHVPFFGRLASSSRTPALLALRTGSPIVVAAAVRRPGGMWLYRLALIEPPPTGQAAAADIRRLTTQVQAVLEGWIREDPLQWRWIHARWKTRPDRGEEQYGQGEVRAAFARAGVQELTGMERRHER